MGSALKFFLVFTSLNAFSRVVLPPTCPVKLEGKSYFPLQVAPKEDEEVALKGNKLFRLGLGTNGIVLKAVEAKKFKVVKAYYQIPVTPRDWDKSTDRDTDLLVLNEFAKEKCVKNAGFHIPGATKTNLTLLRKPNYEVQGIEFTGNIIGRSVFNLVSDETVNSDVRNYVAVEYAARMKKLARCLKRAFSGEEAVSTAAFYKGLPNPVFQRPFLVTQLEFKPDADTQISTQVLIKSDGVIVDPVSLDFYLVDPA